MQRSLIAATLLIALAYMPSGESRQSSDSIWTYVCTQGQCQREPLLPGTKGVSKDVCKLNCFQQGSLFPIPRGNSNIGQNLVGFYPSKVTIGGHEDYFPRVKAMLDEAFEIFQGYLEKMHPPEFNQSNPDYIYKSLNIRLNVQNSEHWILTLGTDESYNLTISTNLNTATATIQADNFYGARHALETLSQLIAYDKVNEVMQVVGTARVEDKPFYKYRGVMLDTSRNFISVDGLKRLIDGLSFNKLNIFHWHMTDSHSFPVEISGMPEFTKFGAYEEEKVYTMEDMKELVSYARVRGVKIVPEFDQPAHTGFGWQWGPEAGLGELVLCLNKEPASRYCYQPPCGQLNVVNENVYDLLKEIYVTLLQIFDNDLFHMGGDELKSLCYNETQEILDWMTENGLNINPDGFMKLWGHFQLKSSQKLMEVTNSQGMNVIQWTSDLTEENYREQFLPKESYIIQIWTNSNDMTIPDLLNAGYRTIFSNVDGLYLDCLTNWCSPYKSWQTVYNNNPYQIYAQHTNASAAEEAYQRGLLLGAVTPLWTEQADEHSFQTRIWPRASALAERLWSNPDQFGQDVTMRMVTNRERFVQRGLKPDQLQPEFCSQYQSNC